VTVRLLLVASALLLLVAALPAARAHAQKIRLSYSSGAWSEGEG